MYNADKQLYTRRIHYVFLEELQAKRCYLKYDRRREQRLYERLQKAVQHEQRRLLLAFIDEKDGQRDICAENSYAAGLSDGIELMVELFGERLKEAEQ